MSTPDNPFSAPRAVSAPNPHADARAWRSGKLLCVERDIELPGRCVHCNETADQFFVRKMQWYSPWWLLFALVGLLPCALVLLIVRKRAKVRIGLCEHHARLRRRTLHNAWALAAAAIVACLALIGVEPAVAGLALLVGLVYASQVGQRGAAILTPVRIDKQHARLSGAGEPFLASLDDARAEG